MQSRGLTAQLGSPHMLLSLCPHSPTGALTASILVFAVLMNHLLELDTLIAQSKRLKRNDSNPKQKQLSTLCSVRMLH
jgi:hypothetical protein